MKKEIINFPVEEIKNKLILYIDNEFKEYQNFSSLIKKYITRSLIEFETLKFINIQLDLYDTTILEKTNSPTNTIKFYLNLHDFYTIQNIYKFNFEKERQENKTKFFICYDSNKKSLCSEYKLNDILDLAIEIFNQTDNYVKSVNVIEEEFKIKLKDIYSFADKVINEKLKEFTLEELEKEVVIILAEEFADELYLEVNNENYKE